MASEVVLFEEVGPGRTVRVCEAGELFGERGRFRTLQFGDGAVQGALDLDRPDRIVLEYPRAMLHLMRHNRPGLESVFMIGLGTGTLASHCPEADFRVAELDASVPGLARRYFGYGRGPVLPGDGRELLAMEPGGRHDFILVDAFTEGGTPAALTSLEFVTMAAGKLREGGALLYNLFGRGEQDRFIGAMFTTLAECFGAGSVKAFVLEGGESSRTVASRNILLAASGRPIGYQARQMAGFREFHPLPGHLIRDR